MPSSKQQRSFELVEEILDRIPIESLVRFKSICKEWYALLNDKRFICRLLDLSQERFIRGADKLIQLVNPETQVPMCLPIPDDLRSHIFRRTIHCDGLLLCLCNERGRSGDTNRKLAVWNPILRRVRWITPSCSYKVCDVYGFGYDNVSRDNYKILRFGKSSEAEIYEFRSKRWRSVDATETPKSHGGYDYYRIRDAVSMNGNMYWVVGHRKNKTDYSKTETFIKSFDFSTGTFKPVCCVPKGTDLFRVNSYHTLALSGFGGDKLSLLHQERHVKIEVWVTNKVTDPVVSWRKYFNVTPPDLPLVESRFYGRYETHFIHKSNKIMLWGEEVYDGECTRANVYEMGEGQIKNQVEVTGQCSWFDLSCKVYVPSLVPVRSRTRVRYL